MSIGTYVSVQNYLNRPSSNNSYSIQHEPLYNMKNALFHDISSNDKDNKDNKTYYTIHADNAIQYEDDKTFSLKNINIYGYQNHQNEDKKTSIITAQNGIIDKDITKVEFSNAQIKGLDSQNKFDISSQHIIFYPELDKVETKSRTNIQQTTNQGKINTLNADSVIFDNFEQNLQLHGKVSGHFNPK
jgi:LPS export ABC transporter protein LptC